VKDGVASANTDDDNKNKDRKDRKDKDDGVGILRITSIIAAGPPPTPTATLPRHYMRTCSK
jgi:hypothetical protein